MIGGLLVKAAFLSTLVSVVSYAVHLRRRDALYLRVGRGFFHGAVLSVLLTSAYLLYLILTHQFQFTYVWSYSSRDLPLPLLVSTFYAGQEGSFMLWTLFTAAIGVFLLRYSSRTGYESEVMPVYGSIMLMLLLMLIVKNPFLYVWESWPGEVQPGFMPADGRGLNPLLQNYWMVIHPQVLFSGFAAMAIPFAYAVAGLIKRDYASWIRPATPWLVFGAMVLGTGIILGGFWAYETLGWGGYWGWDPVENSSLVPWLVSVAAIHTMLSQRRTGAFVRTNLVLSMLCFLLVLYSTFLTRSGVLGDTSVHSFVDPGMWAYVLLLVMLSAFSLLGIGMLIYRWKELPKAASSQSVTSREFALFLGASSLVASAILIIAGTSSPLITDILYGKKSAVDISYYATTNLPIGIAIGILAGLGQIFWWNRSSAREVGRSLIAPSLSSLLLTVLLVVAGVREPLLVLFVFGAAFALLANAIVAWRIFRGNPRFMGGAVAHIGLAIMFFGFLASSRYDEKQTVSLRQGEGVDVLGYTLTYEGYRPIERERYRFDVKVEREGKTFMVSPVMYYSSYNDGLMRNPDIINLITRDFYLAPLSLEQATAERGPGSVSLRRGEVWQSGDIAVGFAGFNMPAVVQAVGGRSSLRLKTRLALAVKGEKPELVEVHADPGATPHIYIDRYAISVEPAEVGSSNPSVLLRVTDLLAQGAGPAPSAGSGDILVAEVSIKPYINLVWTGVIILFVGFMVTLYRRTREASLKAVPLE